MRSVFLIIAAIFLLSHQVKAQIPDSLKYRLLLPKEFKIKCQSVPNLLLIDVREPFETKKGRIKGSVNIPMSGGIKTAADTIKKETALFIYCTSGVRSRKAAISFYDKGFHEVYSLEGGINAWKKDGLPVIRGRKKK